MKTKKNEETQVINTPSAIPDSDKPLMRTNFLVMAAAGVLIVLGFVLMAGSASGADGYNPDIFSTRRIVIGPMLSFLGFVAMAVAIIIKPKKK